MAKLDGREWGTGEQRVVVVHGGPAAVGDVEPLARELSRRWRVLEPFQRGSDGPPLTVAAHVQDLNEYIRDRCGVHRPLLIGHSWGAMLTLAYAAAYSAECVALVLVGCGTFSAASRAEFEERVVARLAASDLEALAAASHSEPDDDHRLAAHGRIMTRVFGYDIEELSSDPRPIDAVAHEQTWTDMRRRQNDGTYPAAFAAIQVPVLMLHGDADPHPGQMISEELRRYVRQLEYRELPHCGHSPWLERQARERFFDELENFLSAQWGRPH